MKAPVSGDVCRRTDTPSQQRRSVDQSRWAVQRAADGGGPPEKLPDPNPPPTDPVSQTPPGQAAERRLDPYWRWAELTKWRGFLRSSPGTGVPCPSATGELCVQIIAQVPDKQSVRSFASIKPEWLHIDRAYLEPIPGAAPETFARCFTARLPVSKVAELVKLSSEFVWELALPLRDAESMDRLATKGLWGKERDRTPFWPTNHLAKVRNKRPARGIGDAIVVIDDGCAFLNSAFGTDARAGRAGPGASRIQAVWDQGSTHRVQAGRPHPEAWPWRPPEHFEYGRELGPDFLRDSHAELRREGSNIEETDAYRGIDHLVAFSDARRRVWLATHGTHVLDVAAGVVDPLTQRGGDAASRANIVYVQLPSLTAADSAGGSLSAHLLDAVRYALAVVRENASVVVSISYGSYAGSHDGHSLIELALDELLAARRDNFAIVLAAGNAARSGCHVQRKVRPGKSALIRFDLAEGDSTDTYLELWYSRQSAIGEIEARVRTPGRDWSSWIGAGDQANLAPESGIEYVAMLRHDRAVPNGGRSMILLAMAPTRPTEETPYELAPAGRWELEVRLLPVESEKARQAEASGSDRWAVVVDAWLERDDASDRPSGIHSQFVDLDEGDERNTLNSLACGQHPLVVGGFRRSDRLPASYSSLAGAEPKDRALDALAVCEEDDLLPSIRASAVRSSEVHRMNGSSVAAPVLARRLFNAMADVAPYTAVPREWWSDVITWLGEAYPDAVMLPPRA